MAKLISKTYGEAIFELAVSENKTDEYAAEMETILSVIRENPEFTAVMNHPKILVEEKLELITNVFGGRASDDITGFLRIIVQKGRYGQIEEIIQYFLDEVKQLKGIGVVYVTVPMELRPEQKEKLEEKLLATTSYKELEMHYALDQSLIGGMVIRIGDRVVDSSISTKLNMLERDLMKIQLKAE